MEKNDDFLNSLLDQYENSTKGQSGNSDNLKKYFSDKLGKDEKKAEKTFRLLPKSADQKTPFQEAWFHNLQVKNAKDGKQEWKKMYCHKKNDGNRCPLCEVEEALRATGDAGDKKTANEYQAKKFYVVKGIDRNAEEDGVKFWRFTHNYKKQGVFDKLIPIFQKKGDITDPRNGRDITITLERDSTNPRATVITSIMAEDVSLLTNVPKTAKEWLGNKETFKDVYSKTDITYMEIVARQETPKWDKEGKKWVSLEESDAKKNDQLDEEIDAIDAEIDEAIGNKPATKPAAKTSTTSTTKTAPAKTTTKVEEEPDVDADFEDVGDKNEGDDDQLPF